MADVSEQTIRGWRTAKAVLESRLSYAARTDSWLYGQFVDQIAGFDLALSSHKMQVEIERVRRA